MSTYTIVKYPDVPVPEPGTVPCWRCIGAIAKRVADYSRAVGDVEVVTPLGPLACFPQAGSAAHGCEHCASIKRPCLSLPSGHSSIAAASALQAYGLSQLSGSAPKPFDKKLVLAAGKARPPESHAIGRRAVASRDLGGAGLPPTGVGLPPAGATSADIQALLLAIQKNTAAMQKHAAVLEAAMDRVEKRVVKGENV
ncbi:hypothetical protein N3K66_002356 [Trichothecium roseum]|uniref:Uncharacterized protein n=1 Tax=Trichothecium roseum TaxID=47278 RepID=A0ACC0V9N0_9HYPO|nr:hypothetical protein N3K66_002356 [Trichothecium roseum]